MWLLPPFAPDLQKAVIIMAAVPMMAIYPILGERYGYRAFCASALLVTTIAAFFSLALVLGLVGGVDVVAMIQTSFLIYLCV